MVMGKELECHGQVRIMVDLRLELSASTVTATVHADDVGLRANVRKKFSTLVQYNCPGFEAVHNRQLDLCVDKLLFHDSVYPHINGVDRISKCC